MTRRADAIARGVAVQFVARALSLVASFVTLGLSTRYLGIDGYGMLVTAIVFVGLFEIGTDLGLSTVITRRVATGAGELARLVSVSLGLKLLVGVPLALLCAGVGFVVYRGEPQAQGAVAIISVGLVLTAVATSYDAVFMVHLRFGAASAADVVARLLGLGATAAVVEGDLGLLAMAGVQLVHPLSRTAFTAGGAARLERLRPVLDLRESRRLVLEGLPFAVMIVVGILYWRADGAILSWLSTPTEVGAYGVAYTLAFNLEVVSTVFAAASFSTLTQWAAEDPERFDSAVRSGYRFLLLCALPIAVLGVPLAGPVLGTFASDEYLGPATEVLRLFFVAVAIGFVNQLISDSLVALHRQRFLLRLSLANLALNIALNLVLVPRLGAVGAGVALVVSQLAGLVVGGVLLHRLRGGLLPLDQVLRMVPVCALAWLAVTVTAPLGIVAQVLAGGAAVLVVALVAGAVPQQGLDLVRARLRRPSTPRPPMTARDRP